MIDLRADVELKYTCIELGTSRNQLDVQLNVGAAPSDIVSSKGGMANVNVSNNKYFNFYSRGGSWKSSSYERWKETYYDTPYDDDECEGLTPQRLAFYDAFDIRLLSHSRRQIIFGLESNVF
ncbi:hypothetical protein Tco_0455341 [Tanacetum coccineum]